MTVWRLWEWAPVSCMMSPAVVHACCGRQAPSSRGWTLLLGQAVPAFSVSGILFVFILQRGPSLLLYPFFSLHPVLICLPLRAQAKGGCCQGLQSRTGKDWDRQSPLPLPTSLTAHSQFELPSHPKESLCYDMIYALCPLMCVSLSTVQVCSCVGLQNQVSVRHSNGHMQFDLGVV